MTTHSPIICLDVAIDHRIKRLCKSTLQPQGVPEPSEHLSILHQHGIRLGRNAEEIKATTGLAGPATTGGILVTLKQPRYNHPFEKGLDAVIRDCESLSALDQLFEAASCGTLSLKRDVSVVDLLPFTPQRVETVPPQALQDAFEASRLAICAKCPDVVLCAGRIWLPSEDGNRTAGTDNQDSFDMKDGLQKLEAAGVGQPDRYDAVGLQGNNGELVTMSRVNGFHPSYAVNYLPEHTKLRQLLLLNVAKTCGLYRGDWQEVRWMDTLRGECFRLTDRITYEKRRIANHPQNHDLERIVYGRSRTIPDYTRIYSTIQNDFLASINKIESSPSQSGQDIYKNLLASGISYKFNDASVVLRKIHELWKTSDIGNAVNMECINTIAYETVEISERVTEKPLQTQSLRLREIIGMGMANMSACFADLKIGFNIEMLADMFLQMAIAIEELLGDLLELEFGHGHGAPPRGSEWLGS
ncbi:hypothetical protein GQX73_g9971 [Xylaria multiplex]|uniref:Uncharacterized protein n=1 Tax=Xylaria multiplex TaxID=323545 RepID=A0A7C8MIU3_9PEZI|nr:hypothetical protein GQX73_g9971 [Xylaria multiplex]